MEQGQVSKLEFNKGERVTITLLVQWKYQAKDGIRHVRTADFTRILYFR